MIRNRIYFCKQVARKVVQKNIAEGVWDATLLPENERSVLWNDDAMNDFWERLVLNHTAQRKMIKIPFLAIHWNELSSTIHKGEKVDALWKTLEFDGLRVRVVVYPSGYAADHWCRRGHLVQCLEGEFTTELHDGRKYVLSRGMGYIVSDDMSLHRSTSEHGATLLIVDGDFLKTSPGSATIL